MIVQWPPPGASSRWNLPPLSVVTCAPLSATSTIANRMGWPAASVTFPLSVSVGGALSTDSSNRAIMASYYSPHDRLAKRLGQSAAALDAFYRRHRMDRQLFLLHLVGPSPDDSCTTACWCRRRSVDGALRRLLSGRKAPSPPRRGAAGVALVQVGGPLHLDHGHLTSGADLLSDGRLSARRQRLTHQPRQRDPARYRHARRRLADL